MRSFLRYGFCLSVTKWAVEAARPYGICKNKTVGYDAHIVPLRQTKSGIVILSERQ